MRLFDNWRRSWHSVLLNSEQFYFLIVLDIRHRCEWEQLLAQVKHCLSFFNPIFFNVVQFQYSAFQTFKKGLLFGSRVRSSKLLEQHDTDCHPRIKGEYHRDITHEGSASYCMLCTRLNVWDEQFSGSVSILIGSVVSWNIKLDGIEDYPEKHGKSANGKAR